LCCMDFTHLAGKTPVAFVVLLFAVERPVASQTPPQPTAAHSGWFTPQLVIDKDPICVRLLPVVRQKFAMDASRYVWNDRNSPNDFGPLNFVFLESLPGEALANASELDNRYPSRYVEVRGKRLYLRSLTHPGCGGACERHSIQVAALRRHRARQLVLEAEEHYAKRRVEESYLAVKKALYAEPGNLRAQRDLALVALRLGRLGEAAEAAMATIQNDSSKASKADAWFNMGLLCERENGSVVYNGQYYCFESPLQLYLRSWNEKPIAAR
jgi:tetratricopeptide (TPR) repeat protein